MNNKSFEKAYTEFLASIERLDAMNLYYQHKGEPPKLSTWKQIERDTNWKPKHD